MAWRRAERRCGFWGALIVIDPVDCETTIGWKPPIFKSAGESEKCRGSSPKAKRKREFPYRQGKIQVATDLAGISLGAFFAAARDRGTVIREVNRDSLVVCNCAAGQNTSYNNRPEPPLGAFSGCSPGPD